MEDTANESEERKAFKAWHYTHGENTQGIGWVDKLLWSCWQARAAIGTEQQPYNAAWWALAVNAAASLEDAANCLSRDIDAMRAAMGAAGHVRFRADKLYQETVAAAKP